MKLSHKKFETLFDKLLQEGLSDEEHAAMNLHVATCRKCEEEIDEIMFLDPQKLIAGLEAMRLQSLKTPPGSEK